MAHLTGNEIQAGLGVITIEEVPEEYREQVKQKLGM